MNIQESFKKICLMCPLCKYTRTAKKRHLVYRLFAVIEFFCPVCQVANLNKNLKSFIREFELRYPLKVSQKVDKKVEVDIEKNTQKNLRLLKRACSRPSMITYYEELLSTNSRIEELKSVKSKGKKIVGTFCNFVPEELIYACGCIPVRLCAGVYDTICFAEEVLPRDICPLIKSSFGFKILGLSYFELCDLVIIPTTCDGKMKLGEVLANYLPVWMLQLPHKKDIRAKDLWLDEIKKLKVKLEEFTGAKISSTKLKQTVEKLHNRHSIFRTLHQLRKHNPPLINGRDFFLVVQSSFYDDIDRWMEKTRQLCDQLKSEIRNLRSEIIRLLLTGAPIIWPNFKILNIIEESGATIVADELCSGIRALYDAVEVDEWTLEGMLRAISTRYLLPSTCPCFTESDDRVDRLLNLIDEFKVDGVVYHSLRLCQLYDIESYKVRQVLKDKRIPLLNIHTDYSYEDTEQIKTRVEAFLEMLK